MEIAIMGAGLSGLSCALTLEKHGINPIIFERRREVEDRFVNGEIFLDVLNAPVKDSIHYFSEKYNVHLKPIGHIENLFIHSENEKASIHGKIGFNTLRGRDENSLGKQLERQVKSEIIYNSNETYESLLEKFSHVVLATGDAAYSVKLKNYRTDLTVSLIGAIVEGKFSRFHAGAWLNNNFAPKGYGYFIPLSDTKANIVIGYPKYAETRNINPKELWESFYSRAKIDLGQSLNIIDTFNVKDYIIGRSISPRIGNTLFAGNCFGSIMPFLGFGQYTSILTGIYAAYDLSGRGSYEKLTRKLYKSYEKSLVLRRAMEQLDNEKFDFLVKAINNKVGKKLLNNPSIDYLSLISSILKFFLKEDSSTK